MFPVNPQTSRSHVTALSRHVCCFSSGFHVSCLPQHFFADIQGWWLLTFYMQKSSTWFVLFVAILQKEVVTKRPEKTAFYCNCKNRKYIGSSKAELCIYKLYQN